MSRGLLIALIALAVSVALNIFAAATVTTTLVGCDRVEDRVEAQHRSGRTGSSMGLVSRLSPEAQPRVRETLHAAAFAARPDFEESRSKRREAIELAAAPAFDPARVQGLLNESRAAELRGRQRLEAGAIAALQGLAPADRAILADILRKRGGRTHGKSGQNSDAEKAAASTRP